MGKYSSIVAALKARIEAHQATDGLLEAFKFVAVPTADVEGQKDFPIIRMFLPEISERLHPVVIVDGEMTLRLVITTERKLGVVHLMEQCEKVMDAIELNGTQIDLTLSGTLARALTISLRDSFIQDNSLNAQLSISCLPRLVTRARRLT